MRSDRSPTPQAGGGRVWFRPLRRPLEVFTGGFSSDGSSRKASGRSGSTGGLAFAKRTHSRVDRVQGFRGLGFGLVSAARPRPRLAGTPSGPCRSLDPRRPRIAWPATLLSSRRTCNAPGLRGGPARSDRGRASPRWASNSVILASISSSSATLAQFRRPSGVEVAPLVRRRGRETRPRSPLDSSPILVSWAFIDADADEVGGPAPSRPSPIAAGPSTSSLRRRDSPGFEQAFDPLGHPPEVADRAPRVVGEGVAEGVDPTAALLVEGVDGVADPLGRPRRFRARWRVRSGPKAWRSCGSASRQGSTEAEAHRGGPRPGARPRPGPPQAKRPPRRSSHAYMSSAEKRPSPRPKPALFPASSSPWLAASRASETSIGASSLRDQR